MGKICLKLILIADLIALTFVALQSEDIDKSIYYDYGKQFFAEVHSIGSIDADSSKVLLMFRVSKNLMTFSKNGNSKLHAGQYIAYPKVYVDYKDSEGIIRKREEWTDTIGVSHYDSTKSKTNFSSGYILSVLPKGKFSINVEFKNDQGIVLKKEKLELDYADDMNKPTINKLILAGGNDNENNSTSPVLDGSGVEFYSPFLLGGNVDFRSKNARIISLVSFKNGFDSYNYLIEYRPDLTDDIWGNVSPLSGQVRAERGKLSGISRTESKENIIFSFDNEKKTVDSKSEQINGYIDLSLPAAFMYPGNYQIKLFSSDFTGDTLTQNFKVEWVDMPVSLRNPDYAAELMYYILNDDEHDELCDGDKTEVMKKIWKYWMGKDPTKYTIYNEAMAEYFKRVDYAFFNYQSIAEKDGAKSDRGKIYILKGAPSDVERKLDEDKTSEIWTYKSLNQKYIFETVQSGKFKLKSITALTEK